MGDKREFTASLALAIALAIFPMTWWIYWSLSFVLIALIVRLIWLSQRPAWITWIASIVAAALLAGILLPEMLGKFAGKG